MTIWSGTDDALGEVPSLPGITSLPLYAPSVNPYTLTRLDWTLTVRSKLTVAGVPNPYWWISAEVIVDVVFATDAVDFTPDITSGDERILNVYQLTPHVAYGPTVGDHTILWKSDPIERQTKGQRKSTTLGSLAPAVFFHVTAADQHGVFATASTDVTKHVHAINLSARALWRADF